MRNRWEYVRPHKQRGATAVTDPVLPQLMSSKLPMCAEGWKYFLTLRTLLPIGVQPHGSIFNTDATLDNAITHKTTNKEVCCIQLCRAGIVLAFPIACCQAGFQICILA